MAHANADAHFRITSSEHERISLPLHGHVRGMLGQRKKQISSSERRQFPRSHRAATTDPTFASPML